MKHVEASGVRVQRRGPGAKTTAVEACMHDSGLFCSQAVHLIWMVVDWVASGSRSCINNSHKWQKFS